MLQKWKRKGKRFRHVEKDGEETTELSVKIRAAKFRDLPMSLRILIVNLSLAPRCRLVASWGWSRSQGFGCSPIKAARELGSERRETVWSLS